MGAFRAWATRHRRFLCLWVLVSVPVLWSAGAHMTGGWVPDGDDASIARRTMQVFTADPPLIGQESTADVAYEDQNPNHLGPVAYYVMAVPYAASGWSPVGLVAGAALVPLVGMGVCLAIGERTAGRRGLAAVGLGLVLLSVRLGPNWLVRPLNAEMIVVPLVATLLGAWAYLRHDRAGLAVVLIAGSFCVQVSLQAVPVAGLTVLGCLAVAGYRRTVASERPPRSGAWWAVVGVLGLMWLPPVLDVIVRWPGNLAVVAEYLLGQVGLVDRTSVAVGQLGLGPAAGSVLTYTTSLPGIGGRDLANDLEVLVGLSGVSLVRVAAGLAALALVTNWALTRGSAALRSLLVVAAAALGAATIGLAARPGQDLATQTYFVIWVQAIAAVAWMAAALASIEAVERLARRVDADARSWPGHVPSLAGVAIVALLAVGVAPRGAPVVREPSRQTTALSRQIRARVPPGTYLIVGQGFSSWVSVSKGVGTDLLAHGYDVRFEDSNEMEDEPRRQGSRDLPRLIVTDDRPDVAGPDLVARYVEPGATFLVRLVPGGPNADWCVGVGDLAHRIRSITGAASGDDPLEVVATAAMWADVLETVDKAELAQARPGSAAAGAAADLTEGLDATIGALGTGSAQAPAPQQVGALRLLLRIYESTCGVEQVPGATALPAGGGEEAPR